LGQKGEIINGRFAERTHVETKQQLTLKIKKTIIFQLVNHYRGLTVIASPLSI